MSVFRRSSSLLLVLKYTSDKSFFHLLEDKRFKKLLHSVVRELSINFVEKLESLPLPDKQKKFLRKEKGLLERLGKCNSLKLLVNLVQQKKNKRKIVVLLELADSLVSQLND